MGWMNDTLKYIEEDPIYRKYHHNKMTFSMAYHYSENFILSISHDEVVHGKGALVNKMWGDYWNKFAGLRLYLVHMIGHPGKKLIFMGSEFGQFEEWNEDKQLQWNLIEEFEMHKKTQLFFKDMNHIRHYGTMIIILKDISGLIQIILKKVYILLLEWIRKRKNL